MMDWQIKRIGRHSSLSGNEFEEGDRILSMIFVDDETGELSRADVLEAELESFDPPSAILGKWTRVVKACGKDADEDDQFKVQSAEEFFLSLFESPPSEQTERETDVLKHMMALILERKRILRQIGARAGDGVQTYRHVARKQEIEVPVIDISPDDMLKVHAVIGELLN